MNEWLKWPFFIESLILSLPLSAKKKLGRRRRKSSEKKHSLERDAYANITESKAKKDEKKQDGLDARDSSEEQLRFENLLVSGCAF